MFDRKYKLTVGKPGEEGLIITDLKISFTATKTVSKEPNKMECDVYNLSPESRKHFVKDNYVKLEVAYSGEDFSTAFIGTLVNVKTYLASSDTITHFDAGDGYTSLRDGKSSHTFPSGTSVDAIVRKLVADMGLSVGKFTNGSLGASTGLNRKYQRGYSVIGSSKSNLDSIISSNGLIYLIQEGTISVLPAGSPSQEGVMLIDPSTGLIGSPEMIQIDGTQSKDKPKESKDTKRAVRVEKTNGVQFKCLMNPDLRLSRRVKVESKFINHVVTIQSITHQGDTHGDEWSTTCEGLI